MIDYAPGYCRQIHANLIWRRSIHHDHRTECGRPRCFLGLQLAKWSVVVFNHPSGQTPEVEPTSHHVGVCRCEGYG